MRFVLAKKLVGHLLIVLAVLFGGRALANEPSTDEPAQEPSQPTEEPAGEEDEKRRR